MFEGLDRDLRAAGTDCDGVASTLSTFNERHQGSYPALAAEAGTSDISPGARTAYDQRLRAAMDGILDQVEACAEHPGAQRAFTEFDVLVDPS